MSENDDEQCIKRLAAGDLQALAPLYTRHRGVVMSVLRQHLRTSSEAADLCQDVFLAFRDMAPRMRPGANARSLLVGIAVRKAKKFAVMTWVRRNLLERNQLADEPSVDSSRRVDAQRDAQRMLSSLPEEWRTVVLLNLVEGWTADEIAESLGISPNTVFTRLYRARQKIREQWPEVAPALAGAHE